MRAKPEILLGCVMAMWLIITVAFYRQTTLPHSERTITEQFMGMYQTITTTLMAGFIGALFPKNDKDNDNQ
jgi:hypothetical protein